MDKKESYVWHEKSVIEKPEKVVVKLHHNDGNFWKSIIVPTAMYPLNGNYEIFTYKNTEVVEDEKIISIFDRHKYEIGRCYKNTEILSKDLLKEGYLAETYVGWLFVDDGELPIHHCWTVVDKKYVLDPSDYFTMIFHPDNQKNLEIENEMSILSSFLKESKDKPNHLVCYPIGKPYPNLLYIGSKCTPDMGRYIYQRLMKTYPDHECDRTDKNGLNKTQKLLMKNGLM